jgi:hypothetical protein
MLRHCMSALAFQVLVRMMLRPINPTDLMLSRGW